MNTATATPEVCAHEDARPTGIPEPTPGNGALDDLLAQESPATLGAILACVRLATRHGLADSIMEVAAQQLAEQLPGADPECEVMPVREWKAFADGYHRRTTRTPAEADAMDLTALNTMLDNAPDQAKAMTLTCLTLAMVNNSVGDHVRRRLHQEVQEIAERLGSATTGDPDDLAREWLALLAGIEYGYQDAL